MFVDRCGDGAEADFRRRLNLAEEAGLSVYCYSSVTGVKAWISREVGDEEKKCSSSFIDKALVAWQGCSAARLLASVKEAVAPTSVYPPAPILECQGNCIALN
jgi:hypothetical protein